MNNLKLIETGLIKVYETDKGEKVVNARELHEGLDSKTKYNDWITRRLLDIDAIENEDYIVLLKNEQNLKGGRPTKEYILKLDTAKEVAMLERNEKGKQYRRYLIEVEKKYKEIALNVSNLSPELQMFNSLFNTLAKIELENKQIGIQVTEQKQELQDIKNLLALNPNEWRSEINKILNSLGAKMSDYKVARNTAYELLESRGHCRLSTRVRNIQKELALKGVCKTKIEKVNKMDAIEQDVRLKEIFTTICKEMYIKYC